MHALTHNEVTVFIFAVGVLMVTARLLGELAIYLRQPAILGEICAGIILGPTVLGSIAPQVNAFIFPIDGSLPFAIDGVATLAVVLFMLVAGMEVDLSTVWNLRKNSIFIGIVGIVFPFAIGFSSVYIFKGVFNPGGIGNQFFLAMFFAVALSICALPVIAKILMDLNILRTDLGMIIIASAILDDLVGWIIFAVILSLMNGGAHIGLSAGKTVALTLAFAGVVLTGGRWLMNRVLPLIQAHSSGPAGILSFALTGALFCSAFTSWIGIHAVFGAFIFGVAIGDSKHLREQTRRVLDQFISYIFAPLFFATIGLRVNFIANFDLQLVLLVLALATVGKVIGCRVGAGLSGLKPREAWAVGFGLNARGAMEIILGLLALHAGLITERLFVSLVIMALVTSMTSGTMIQVFLKKTKKVFFTKYLAPRGFCGTIDAKDRNTAIKILSRAVCSGTDLNPDTVFNAALERENVASTGVGNGIAIPIARIDGISRTCFAMAFSEDGVDFESFDGMPAKILFLIVSPIDDMNTPLNIMADIARIFKEPKAVGEALRITDRTEFIAYAKSLQSTADRSYGKRSRDNNENEND